MKFEKLFEIVTEAAKGVQGGNALLRAKEAEGPVGMPSASAGFAQNPMAREKIKKWDFDPDIHVWGATAEENKAKKAATQGMKDVKSEMNKMWRVLNNSFSLLRNDSDFDNKVNSIISETDKQRESYRNVIFGVDEVTGKDTITKQDDESRLEVLPKTLDKCAGDIEDTKQVIKSYKRKLRNYTMPRSEIRNLEKEIYSLTGSVKADKRYLSSDQNKKLFKEYSKLRAKKLKIKDTVINLRLDFKTSTNPNRINLDLDRANLDLQEVEQEMAVGKFNRIRATADGMFTDLVKLKEKRKDLDETSPPLNALEEVRTKLDTQYKKLEKLQEKEKTLTAERDTLVDRLNQIGKVNFDLNQEAISRFIKQMIHSAGIVKDQIESKKTKNKKEGLKSFDQLDWSEMPKKLDEKEKMVETLMVPDENNPIFAYLDAVYRRTFGVSDSVGSIFDPTTNTFNTATADTATQDIVKLKDLNSREFDKNANITTIRDYNSLPFVRLANIYSQSGKTRMPIDWTSEDIDLDQYNRYYEKLAKFLTGFVSTNDPKYIKVYKDMWDGVRTDKDDTTPTVKSKMGNFIMNLGLSPEDTSGLLTFLNTKFQVNRRGVNSFQMLLAKINSVGPKKDKSHTGRVYESFDSVFTKVLKRTQYNDDELKIGLLEVFKKQ